MAIEKKLICFARLEEFERQLAAGNILDYSIVFIQDAKKIWTHGEFYDCSQTDLSEYLTADEIAEVYATTTQLSGKQDTISDLDTIRSGAAKGATALQSYTEKYTGTITGITMNGASKGTSGVVNLGTVITEHQTLKTINGKSIVGSGDITISVANLSVSITWSELKALRDAGKLVPGIQYRITDYTCTTTQENTKSAGHIFDIIVTADDESTLNEVARAVKHEGDTYFANSNLSAWKIWYCLDNDTNKFVWADATNGKGVIYRMIDEWNNDCPYDFKNMMFKVYYDDDFGAYKVGAKDNSEWSYTFCMIDRYDNKAPDVSVEQYKYTGDEGFYYHTHDNRMLPYYDEYANASGESNVDSGAYVLNANVFVTDTDICSVEEDYSYSEFYAFCNNTLGNDCYGNTFGNVCNSNTFGNNCDSNTFGNNCGYNTFGNHCGYNTFGNACCNNTLEKDCGYNTFGNACDSNTFGNNCDSNTFGNDCCNNTLENDCGYNTFGNDCCNNTLENDCGYNTFGNVCNSNTFGNNCDSNTFGNYIQESQFGDCVQSFSITTQQMTTKPTASNTKSYIRWLIVENGVRYVNVYVTASTSSGSYCQNVRICQGCSGINSRIYKSFAINNVGGIRQVIVCYDTSGTLRTGNIGNLLAKL